MPAPAVIPAPKAYTKIAVVKTLVVDIRTASEQPACSSLCVKVAIPEACLKWALVIQGLGDRSWRIKLVG